MFFVMPHYREQNTIAEQQFYLSMNSLLDQTDMDWQLVIVDDASSTVVQKQLKDLAEKHPSKVHVLYMPSNRGPGYCRNIGIQEASRLGGSFILFQDSDDQSHSQRVAKTRHIFTQNKHVDVIYSPFKVINEKGAYVDSKYLTASIRQILDVYQKPPSGKDLWIQMGTETGYFNLTSATSVRIDLALRQPFVEERVSEDFHTWMRYAADGHFFHFEPSIFTKYHIASNCAAGSQSRMAIGKNFYHEKARVDSHGFEAAMQIALNKKSISPIESMCLRKKFKHKLQELLSEECV